MQFKTWALFHCRCCLRPPNGVARRVHGGKDLTLLGDPIEEEVVGTERLDVLCPILAFADAWDVTQRWLEFSWNRNWNISTSKVSLLTKPFSSVLALLVEVGGTRGLVPVHAKVDVHVDVSRKAGTVLKQDPPQSNILSLPVDSLCWSEYIQETPCCCSGRLARSRNCRIFCTAPHRW